MKVGVLIYATGLLSNYLPEFLSNMHTYFLPGQRKKLYIFTDKGDLSNKEDEIEFIKVPCKEPLYKYHRFDSIRKKLIAETEILIYIDVKVLFTREFGSDSLPSKNKPLVIHGKPDKINCMIQGGLTRYFLKLVSYVATKIELDDNRNLLNTNNYYYLQYLAPHVNAQKIISCPYILNSKNYSQPYITCELSTDIYLVLKQLYLMLEAEQITGKKFILHNQHFSYKRTIQEVRRSTLDWRSSIFRNVLMQNLKSTKFQEITETEDLRFDNKNNLITKFTFTKFVPDPVVLRSLRNIIHVNDGSFNFNFNRSTCAVYIDELNESELSALRSISMNLVLIGKEDPALEELSYKFITETDKSKIFSQLCHYEHHVTCKPFTLNWWASKLNKAGKLSDSYTQTDFGDTKESQTN